MEADKLPPQALIDTWVWMVKDGGDEQVRSQAAQNLIGVFGSEQAVIDYLSSNERPNN